MFKYNEKINNILFICKRHEEMRKNNDKIRRNLAIRVLRKAINEIKHN
jgi:hypothetical protein